MKTILGINGYSARHPDKGIAHNAGAALVREGRILAAVDEERISRVKNDKSYPFGAINAVLSDREHPEFIAVAGLSRHSVLHSMRSQLQQALKQSTRADFRRYLRSRLLDLPVRAAIERVRPRTVPGSLRKLPRREIRHHEAHAASAYFCCPWPDDRVLVLTLDSFGDAQCGTCWIGENGKLAFDHELPFIHSIGGLYTAFTHHLGFKALQHEGKIVGLASYGNPHPMHDRLMNNIRLEANGWFRFNADLIQLSIAAMHPGAKEIFDSLTAGLVREDIAAGLQSATEYLVTRWVAHCCRRHQCTRLALAGGVFANVKLNQRILELPEVENVYIHPNMGDGGLASGAALAAAAGVCGNLPPRLLESVYLGPDISDDEAEKALSSAGLNFENPDNLPERVAELLAEGKVVARAAGRMEYGPRALGNRSILAACGDPTINQWLNDRLNRT
ncbi:MAG: hypothetical protein D6681_03785, partial [Calditrichaeota bacterium]